MKLIKIISIIVSTLLATESFADKTTATVQKDLNLLGYNAGPVDGSYGKKTRIALEQFYKDNGGVFDGKLDGNEIKDLKLKIKQSSKNKGPEFVIKLATNDLDQIIVPQKWPFVQISNFLSKHQKQNVGDWGVNINDVENCVSLLTNWKSNNSQHQMERDRDNCIQVLGWNYYDREDIKPFETILLKWANTDNLKYKLILTDVTHDRYDVKAFLSTFGSFYAVKYDEFSYTNAQRSKVDEYLQSKLLNINEDEIGEPKRRIHCDPKKHSSIGNANLNKQVDIDICGSSRWKITIAQLLLASRFSNNDLWERGVYNTKFQLEQFDKDGIYVTWATRGALSWDYSHDVTTMLSLMTEIFDAAGYDFLNHDLSNKLKVYELFDKQFQIVDDVSILEKYAKRNYGNKGTNYSKWRKLSNKERIGDWNKATMAYSSLSYIKAHNPKLSSLIECNYNPVFSPNSQAITNFNIVDIWDLYYGLGKSKVCN